MRSCNWLHLHHYHSPNVIALSMGMAVTRKDGELVCVAGAQVAVTMPDRTEEVYALMRETTQEKRAQEALRLHPQRLIETQEADGLRIARELHDEIGQPLTGVIMLGMEDLPPRPQKRLAEARARIAGGTLTLISALGEGTRVIAELPVEREERPR